ncbi:MAG: hypothetical protein MJZ16_03450 [Bacteroidales bacterium]|nr:hypothetical protein [Bacteroidales bacterium]
MQIYLGEEQRGLIFETGRLYRMACNEVSKYVFDSDCMNFYKVNDAFVISKMQQFSRPTEVAREFYPPR